MIERKQGNILSNNSGIIVHGCNGDDSVLGELFYYDETSSTCLRWKVDRRAGNSERIIVAHKGDEAGSIDFRNESIVTRFKGKLVKVHKVILAIHGILEFKDRVIIDHIDGNPLNNLITNLRVVSHSENARNRKKQMNNTSGTAGVSLWEDQKGGKFWIARWYEDYKRKVRCFSIRKYGHDTAYQMAVEVRENAIQKLKEEGYGYTERHGK